jgi:hypothetical protein
LLTNRSNVPAAPGDVGAAQLAKILERGLAGL